MQLDYRKEIATRRAEIELIKKENAKKNEEEADVPPPLTLEKKARKEIRQGSRWTVTQGQPVQGWSAWISEAVEAS